MNSGPRRGGIFICYRRDETGVQAGRLFGFLSGRFGEDSISADPDIGPGVDYTTAIAEAVSACEIMLVLIGPKWSAIADSKGRKRIDNPGDFVRIQIETALQQHIPVIPVLLDGARMPVTDQLPASLTGLARREAIELRPSSFGADTSRLLEAMEQIFVPEVQKKQEVSAGTAAAPVAEARAKQEEWAKASPLRLSKIFLCYRREDTQGFARGIYQSLAEKYGHEQVFRDIDSTPPGVRFSDWIESRVSQCGVMIVLIGKGWLSAEDEDKQRRLDLPKDWVRHEIGVALSRGIPIIPVLVQGAPMPSEAELPDSIADLAGFQSTEVTDSRWDFDVGVLIQGIDYLIASDQSK